MKNIFDILKSVGAEISEDKKPAFETEFNANYKTVAELEKVKTARDNYKSQLDTATESLKGFEGVDVNQLKSTISALQNDLKEKDNELNKKIVDMEFNNAVDSALNSFKAKNNKAVKALLDLNALKESKNQAEDIKSALENIKKENDFLFVSDEPIDNPVKNTGNTQLTGGLSDMLRASMGLPEKKG